LKSKKHIFSLLASLLFMAFALRSYANNSSPKILCIAVDSVGDVTVTWQIPADTDYHTFVSYNVYSSSVKGGPYTLSASVNPENISSTTITGLGANTGSIYFYVQTETTGGPSPNVDTLQSIYLNLINPGNGTAVLLWNALSTPLPATSSGWYRVYREYPQYVWTLVDSTRGLSFIDTITFCNQFLQYKVELEDASGCNSVSNRASGTFKDKIAPVTPLMDSVSVTATNGVNISWSQSPNQNVIGYVVYEVIQGRDIPIDTVWGLNNLHYFDPGANPDSATIGFVVASLDSCYHPSLLSKQENTLYLMEAPDSCLNANLLTWTANAGSVPGVETYKVYISVNSAPYTLLGTVNSKTFSFLQTGLTHVGTFNYFVVAVDSADPAITASSNIITYKVTLPPIPQFSYLQTATVVNDVSVAVNCYVDISAHCTNYELRRANSINGPYAAVASVNSPAPFLQFSDLTAIPNQQAYYYKVVTQNQCGVDVDSSQISQTMFLTAVANDDGTNTLTWNDYSKWLNGVSYYNIYRNEDDGPFTQVGTSYYGGGTSVYKDDISAILQGEGVFSYYVKAVEQPNNTYPFVDTSLSNIAEAYQDPRVYIPNAFSPLGKNKIFIPIGVFVNVTGYEFDIFDRLGQQVFGTQDYTQGWNGVYGGKVCMEGVFVYLLTYTSSKGEYFERKGTVTLIK
jgi:hypothetical protein